MKKLQNLFASANAKKAAFVAAAVAATSSANAALPEAVTTAYANLQTDGLAMADLAWPVVGAIFASVLLFKLFKRFGNKI